MNEKNKLYDISKLPEGLEKVGETPFMTDKTVFPDILKNHMAPKNKLGYIVVKEGELDYVWEDEEDNIYTVDAEHPLVIYPERYHHVILKGAVQFKIEFYKYEIKNPHDSTALRPGEQFV
ncbi:MAG: DUF1971 domain-containing protein [Cetobacterium sp.]|uniref:DUF1971 domain-containing protein n=1 Tax=Cetobacterium sp. TaxID=2071632 RepID=UPI003F3399B6